MTFSRKLDTLLGVDDASLELATENRRTELDAVINWSLHCLEVTTPNNPDQLLHLFPNRHESIRSAMSEQAQAATNVGGAVVKGEQVDAQTYMGLQAAKRASLAALPANSIEIDDTGAHSTRLPMLFSGKDLPKNGYIDQLSADLAAQSDDSDPSTEFSVDNDQFATAA
ncbi:hypothetical protein KC878_03710 [Candidatus Saccharibacteria bacterium]|nr:hypothetical protein [Candidatus Saccharibacteria bacterium]